jgi:hypothetical protein
MQPQELMRAIIDAINSHDQTTEIGNDPVVNEPRQEEVIVIRDLSPDATGQTQDDPTITDTFVPPLQQKLELLKKAAGIPNIYDADEDGECGCTPDEDLSMNQIFMQEVSNDEITDD